MRVERGVRLAQTIRVVPEGGEPVSVVVCHLVEGGTLNKIFTRLGPRHLVDIPPNVVDAIGRDHRDVLLEEDHATLILSDGIVVNLEISDTGRLERNEFNIDHGWHWLPEHFHQLIVREELFS